MVGGTAMTSKKGDSGNNGGHLRRSNSSNDSGHGMENGLYYQQTDKWVFNTLKMLLTFLTF